MGPRTGRPRRGQLADLTIYPQPSPVYERPPEKDCEVYPGEFVLRRGHEVRTEYWLLDDTYMVFFAVVQIAYRDDGWQEVARIDTCHATVHKHQLHRSAPADSVGTRTELCEIPANGGWSVIETWYSQSLDHMRDCWQENLRLWGGDYE